MIETLTTPKNFCGLSLTGLRTFLFFFLCVLPLAAQSQIAVPGPDNTVIIDEAPEMEVLSYGKTVIVKKSAKGVLVFGGDAIIEGRVDGDVATIGGSVIQKENSFIGGDVIILGGKYKTDDAVPLRTGGKETVMYAGYEDEFRDLVHNPGQMFAPTFSFGFVAQRLLSILFWFVISLALTTISPGAISRSVARIHLSTRKIIAIGFFSFLAMTVVVIGSTKIIPSYLSTVLGLMAFLLTMLAYVFGRVTLHVSFGKMIQKHFLPEKNKSEALAIFIGVVVWTVLLSVPYLWTLALIGLFSAGIGLVLTSRQPTVWKSQ